MGDGLWLPGESSGRTTGGQGAGRCALWRHGLPHGRGLARSGRGSFGGCRRRHHARPLACAHLHRRHESGQARVLPEARLPQHPGGTSPRARCRRDGRHVPERFPATVAVRVSRRVRTGAQRLHGRGAPVRDVLPRGSRRLLGPCARSPPPTGAGLLCAGHVGSVAGTGAALGKQRLHPGHTRADAVAMEQSHGFGNDGRLGRAPL